MVSRGWQLPRRFCKPLDMPLLRQMAAEHSVMITIEENGIGGFGSHGAFSLAPGVVIFLVAFGPVQSRCVTSTAACGHAALQSCARSDGCSRRRLGELKGLPAVAPGVCAQ
jgi:hypothetical protein